MAIATLMGPWCRPSFNLSLKKHPIMRQCSRASNERGRQLRRPYSLLSISAACKMYSSASFRSSVCVSGSVMAWA